MWSRRLMFEDYFRNTNSEICSGNAGDKTRKDSQLLLAIGYKIVLEKDRVIAGK